MNRFFWKKVLFTLFLGILLISCKNVNTHLDGVFNPEKKIAKISCYTDDHLMGYSVYNWDGDLLKSIDVYFEQEVATSMKYSYNTDNQVVRVENDVTITEFEYDDSKRLVKSVQTDVESGQVWYSETVLARDKEGNITLLQCDYMMADRVDRTETRYTWERGNYATETLEFNDRTDKVTYTYDDKINPMYGLMTLHNFIFQQTKNNRIAGASVSTDGSSQAISTLFTYDADGYPVETVQENPIHGTKYIERYEYY